MRHGRGFVRAAFSSAKFAATGKVKLDSADKSDTVSFAKNAVSKELGENRVAPCGHFAIACALARYAVCAASLRCSASRLIFGAS